MPPVSIFRCTSDTREPIYLDMYGRPVAGSFSWQYLSKFLNPVREFDIVAFINGIDPSLGRGFNIGV